jgi:uncharacterized membrane protein
MNGAKSWYQSTTIQGAIVGVIIANIALLKAFGIEIDIDQGQITEIVGAIILVVSSFVVIYGRIKAKYVISK